MDYLLVTVSAVAVAALTLFSGFGLGSLLMPVFAVFFPIKIAVAATAVVHLANNLFKLALVGKHAVWPVVLRFGVPALPAALGGALLLAGLSKLEPITRYRLGGRECDVTWIGIVMAILIAVFALLDLLVSPERVQLDRKYLPLGGLLSGFFGGLSGHQGALRAAFLIKCDLSREAFIGTGVVCAVAVDVIRLPVYLLEGDLVGLRDGRATGLVIAATVAAFLGSFLGARWMRKVTLQGIRRLVGALLLLLAVAIGSGLA